ncbi:hypothetical protein BC941DRAFT_464496 [Chlamydoabsidia padenii]|nr:hypothetical protein BC941DRAFT_464496 [Chlamydoabsidia padenii]
MAVVMQGTVGTYDYNVDNVDLARVIEGLQLVGNAQQNMMGIAGWIFITLTSAGAALNIIHNQLQFGLAWS